MYRSEGVHVTKKQSGSLPPSYLQPTVLCLFLWILSMSSRTWSFFQAEQMSYTSRSEWTLRQMGDRVPKLSQNQQLVSVIIASLNTEEEEEELWLLGVDVGVSLSLYSFLQGRSSRERSPCVKTRRTPARCWSPLTSETGSWLTACSNIRQIQPTFYRPYVFSQHVGAE